MSSLPGLRHPLPGASFGVRAELMTHTTQPRFVYGHERTRGDLLVWDDRCLIHAATWFDAENQACVT